MVVAAIAIALVFIELDSSISSDWLANYPRLFGHGAEGSRGMLTAIASSMLTVATLAFSLTLNTISQASAQFTPRIYRNFMRDRANQFVLGYFVSVFAYCLIVLRTIRGADEQFIPSVAVLAGLLLALGGIVVLIYFIHHIAESLQITKILENITVETRKAIERMFPQELGEPAAASQKKDTDLELPAGPWQPIPALQPGYLQSIEMDALLAHAAEQDCVIRMRLAIGQFAATGATIAEISSGVKPDAEQVAKINKPFHLDRYRTIEQDVGFGIRQIVDIALKSLSPGVNDVSTAITCIDTLAEIVGTIARRRMPEAVRQKDGVPRVIAAAPDFEDYVEEAFDQIRVAGKANRGIHERLLKSLIFLGGQIDDPGRRAPLRRQAELAGRAAMFYLETDYDRAKVSLLLKQAETTFGPLLPA